MGRFLLIALAALLLVGCNGGTVDRHALTNDAATLDSVACEGALLAKDVLHGKTTRFYAGEQAEELKIQSSNLADALAHRPTVAGIEQRVRVKAQAAAKVAALLGRLQRDPGDRRKAAAVAARLTRLGGCA